MGIVLRCRENLKMLAVRVADVNDDHYEPDDGGHYANNLAVDVDLVIAGVRQKSADGQAYSEGSEHAAGMRDH